MTYNVFSVTLNPTQSIPRRGGGGYDHPAGSAVTGGRCLPFLVQKRFTKKPKRDKWRVCPDHGRCCRGNICMCGHTMDMITYVLRFA